MNVDQVSGTAELGRCLGKISSLNLLSRMAGPRVAGDIGGLAIQGRLTVQGLHLAGDVLDDLGHLHDGLHLLGCVEGQEVEELLQAGLGVLQVRVDRLPNVLRVEIFSLL